MPAGREDMVHSVTKQEENRKSCKKKEMNRKCGQAIKPQGPPSHPPPTTSDPLPPANLYPMDTLSPSQMEPLAEGQVFKHRH